MVARISVVVMLLGATCARATGNIVVDSFDRDGLITWRGAQIGSTCQVEEATSLIGSGATNWVVLTNLAVSHHVMTSSVPTGPSDPHFYRISGIPTSGGDVTEGLVAYYPLDGSADDLSGMGNHGTLHGPTPVADRFGTPGSAYAFDGTGYIDVSNAPSLNITGAITIAVWVKADTTTEPGYVVAKGDFEPYAISIPEWPHFPGAGKDFVVLLDGNHFNATCPIATWTHIAFTYDPPDGAVRQYVDGALLAQHPYSSPLVVNDDPLQIGRRLPNHFHFNGDIDDLRIYDRALTSYEVWTLYTTAP